MSAYQITLYYGDVPLRDGSQTNTVFSNNVGAFYTFYAASIPDVNTGLTWVNTQLTTIEGYKTAAEAAAITATEKADISTAQAVISTTKAEEAAASAASAASSPNVSATSTTSISLGYGEKSFTLVETGKEFVVDQFVTVASSADPSNFYFNGAITAFNAGTGAITVDSRAFFGVGSASDWTITSSAPAQGQRFTNPTQSFVALGNVSGTVNFDLRVALNFSCTIVGNTIFTVTLPDGYTSADSIAWTNRITMGGTLYSIGYPAGTKYHEGSNPITAINTTDRVVYDKLGTAPAEVRRAARAIA